jgi:hypothetical protein
MKCSDKSFGKTITCKYIKGTCLSKRDPRYLTGIEGQLISNQLAGFTTTMKGTIRKRTQISISQLSSINKE